MKPGRPDLGNELLNLENMTSERKSEYERRIRQMIESELRPWQRAIVLILAVIGIGGVILTIYLTAKNMYFPERSLLAFVPSILFWTVWSAIAIYMLYTGRVTRKLSNIVAAFIWGCVLFLFIGSMFALDRIVNPEITIAVMALGWLVIGAVMVVINQIRQTAFKSQEEVVRLQLQMLELSEKLDRLADGHNAQSTQGE